LSSRLLSRNVKVKIHRIIILPVLYVCEICSLTLREEHGLRVFENRVLRRIFGPTGGACGRHGRGEESVQDFGGKAQSKKIIRKTEA
jgi:hypothetical protein